MLHADSPVVTINLTHEPDGKFHMNPDVPIQPAHGGAACEYWLPTSGSYNQPVLKTLRYVLAAAMAAFALLQLNDPDPLVWVVAYGLVACCVAAPSAAAWSVRGAWLTGGVLLTLALGALPGFVDYLFSGDFGSIAAEMSPGQPHVEPAREFLGVVIAGAVLIGGRRLSAPGSQVAMP